MTEPKDGATPKNSWIRETEEIVIDSPVMQIYRQKRSSTENQRQSHNFYVMRSRDWCNVIPVTEEGNLVLIRQYRVGIENHTLELPGGVADASDETPMATAIREMTEETGYLPTPEARCEPLGWAHPNPAIQNNRCHSFIVGPVRKEKEQKLDPSEMIEVIEVPIAEAIGYLREGRISHALMLNTFFHLLLKHGSGESLTRLLRGFSGAPESATWGR